eukprot:15339512-Ditylum_brightwellii.AAC.1
MASSLDDLLAASSKNEVDEVAVIQAAQQIPKDIDCTIKFFFYINSFHCIRKHCPLHLVIPLRLETDVITSLISPTVIIQKDNTCHPPLYWIYK